MEERLINYIVKNSKDILIQVGNISIKRGELFKKSEINLDSKIGVIVGITGKLSGQIVFSFPDEYGKKIASFALGDIPIVTLDDKSKVSLCHAVNLILGNTLTNLMEDGLILDMTPCGILEGSENTYSFPDYDITSIPLISKDAVIEIDLCILKKETN